MKKTFFFIFSSILLATILIFFNVTVINTSTFKVRKETIISDKIDKDLNGLILTYFSDLHYKNESDNKYLEKIVNKINELDSDIVIFGGDLIDSLNKDSISQTSIDILTESFSKINSTYGKYYVLGDCDLDANNTAIKILTNSSFKQIDNNTASVYIDTNSFINLVGINDNTSLFNEINTAGYTFAISHYPDTFNSIVGYDFDYMLAGHSHGGQIYLPLINKYTRLPGYQLYIKGKTKQNNKTLDITNGLGTTKNNARLFADAEIVVYRLLSK